MRNDLFNLLSYVLVQIFINLSVIDELHFVACLFKDLFDLHVHQAAHKFLLFLDTYRVHPQVLRKGVPLLACVVRLWHLIFDHSITVFGRAHQ